MAYQSAVAWDNAAGLADLTIQPKCEYVKPGRVQVALDQLTYADGYDNLKLTFTTTTEAERVTILSELGVSAAESAKMTMKVPTRLSRTFANYNVVVNRSTDEKYQFGFWKQLEFDVVLIEAL